MAAAKQLTKVIKKKWFAIHATPAFNSVFLGDCYTTSADRLVGRALTVNLATITNDIRQQAVNLKFSVAKVEDDKGVAEIVGYELSPSSIRRMVRRGSDRLDETMSCETKDGKKLIMKMMMVTKSSTTSSVHKALRRRLVDLATKEAKSQLYDSFVEAILGAKFQTAVKADLKKIYPLKAIEIKRFGLVRKKERTEAKQDKSEVKQETAAAAKGEAVA